MKHDEKKFWLMLLSVIFNLTILSTFLVSCIITWFVVFRHILGIFSPIEVTAFFITLVAATMYIFSEIVNLYKGEY